MAAELCKMVGGWLVGCTDRWILLGYTVGYAKINVIVSITSIVNSICSF